MRVARLMQSDAIIVRKYMDLQPILHPGQAQNHQPLHPSPSVTVKRVSSRVKKALNNQRTIAEQSISKILGFDGCFFFHNTLSKLCHASSTCLQLHSFKRYSIYLF